MAPTLTVMPRCLAWALLIASAIAMLCTSTGLAQRCPIRPAVGPPAWTEPPPDPLQEQSSSGHLPQPHTAPTRSEASALRVLTLEVDWYLERGRRFRDTVEHLADRQEDRIAAGLRRWTIPDPPARFAAPPVTEASSSALPIRSRDAIDAYLATLDRGTDVDTSAGTASEPQEEVQALAALLEQPAAIPGDPSTAGCASMMARATDDPSYRLRRANACVQIRRIVDGAELASLPGSTEWPASNDAWTPLVSADARARPAVLAQMAVDASRRGDDAAAVILLRVLLSRYPMDVSAPRARRALTTAWRRLGHDAQAAENDAAMADYAPGTPWARIHASIPAIVDAALPMVTEGLRSAARSLLDLAARYREARDRAHTAAETAACDREEHRALGNAADAIEHYVSLDPDVEDRPALRVLRGDALAGAGRDDEAARAYDLVLDDPLAAGYTWRAARSMIEARERVLITLVREGTVTPCDAVRGGVDVYALKDAGLRLVADAEGLAECSHPPLDVGGHIREVPVPEAVDAVIQARDRALQVFPDSVGPNVRVWCPIDGSAVRVNIAWRNARTLLRFGHVADAERRERSVMAAYCADPVAARAAMSDLRDLYVRENRHDDFVQLARAQGTLMHCGPIYNLFVDQMWSDPFSQDLQHFHWAEHAPANEAVRLYEQAGEELLHDVDARNEDPNAPLALFYAALAFERAERAATAAGIYRRIRQEYASLQDASGCSLTGEALSERVNILEQSAFRLAINSERMFEFDDALRAYHDLATEPTWAYVTSHDLDRHDALASIYRITASLGRWSEAAAALRAISPHTDTERAEVHLHLAEIPYRAGRWRAAQVALREFLRLVTVTPETAHVRVVAAYEIAQACRHLGDRPGEREALADVGRIFDASGLPPGYPSGGTSPTGQTTA